jgi:hypothetical protein
MDSLAWYVRYVHIWLNTLATDRHFPVTIEHYLQAQQHFLTERFDKNIINIVQKAREKRAFMLKLLFDDEPVPFTIDDPDIAWLYANGVVDKKDGYVDILVPLYAKRLINAFRPLINGETHYYINSPHDTLNQYLTKEGALNILMLCLKNTELMYVGEVFGLLILKICKKQLGIIH